MPSAIIVDDSRIMRAQLHRLLVTAGCSVVAELGRGDEVIEHYERHRPDLVTLDIVMPGRDGVSVAIDLLARHPGARVVMCTSLGSTAQFEACRRAGVRHYLLKPINPELAVVMFRQALGKPAASLPWVGDEPRAAAGQHGDG
jgi:two-component system, chemotaxis family, chemotaxis protein CheY